MCTEQALETYVRFVYRAYKIFVIIFALVHAAVNSALVVFGIDSSTEQQLGK